MDNGYQLTPMIELHFSVIEIQGNLVYRFCCNYLEDARQAALPDKSPTFLMFPF